MKTKVRYLYIPIRMETCKILKKICQMMTTTQNKYDSRTVLEPGAKCKMIQ